MRPVPMAQRLTFQRLFFQIRSKGQSFTAFESTVCVSISMRHLGIGIKGRAGYRTGVGLGVRAHSRLPLELYCTLLNRTSFLIFLSRTSHPLCLQAIDCVRSFCPRHSLKYYVPNRMVERIQKTVLSKTVFSTRFESTVSEKTVSGALELQGRKQLLGSFIGPATVHSGHA